MILASRRIKNISSVETEIGALEYVVPNMVIKELEKITMDNKKKTPAENALKIIKNFQTIVISGKYVDDALVSYVKENGGIIATIDAELKSRIKKTGGSVISIASDKIVLEPSKL